MLILLGAFFFIINVFQISSYDMRPVVRPNVRYVIDEEHEGYLIKTIGCRIPKMDPFHHSILQYVDNSSRQAICNNGLPSLVESNVNTLYIVNSSFEAYNVTDFSKLQCCYRPFVRLIPQPHESDKKIKYSPNCMNFTEPVTIDDEFVRVICNYNGSQIYKEFFSFIPLKNGTTPSPSKDFMNVLIIGIDSISRLNLIRTMPKTAAYLQNISAFQFLGYNKVADNTFPNLMPALAGLTVEESEKVCWINDTHFDSCPFVWKNFKSRNYTTAFVEDTAWMGTFNYIKNGFGEQPTDYYWSIFNYVDEKENGNEHEMNVFRCVGPKQVYKKIIDYNRRFVHTMENNSVPYFGFFWAASLSHDYLNYPMIADDDYHDLLDEFRRKGYFEHTALIVMSDHGMRFGNIRSTYQGMMEERLPFLYMTLPKTFLDQHPEIEFNLRANERRLTTHFDLHETLLDLLDYKNLSLKYVDSENARNSSKKAYSLFDKVPSTRTCASAGIAEHWCTCQNSVEIDTSRAEVAVAGSFAVDYINNMLSPYEQCANLSLNNVTSARLHTHSKELKFEAEDYTILFGTNPSDAMFEATVRLNAERKEYNVIGTISRINMYGNQSYCVPNFQMKLYCFCKDLLDTS